MLGLCVGLGAMGAGSGLAAEVIRIGQSLPDTPESYKILTSIDYATEALVAAVNARGGIRGVPVDLVTLKDDGTSAGYARNVERLLTQDKVLAIVNCIDDRRCIAAGEQVRAHDAALVGTLCGAPALRTSPTHVFPVRAAYAAEADTLARQLATIGVGSIAVLSDGASAPAKRQLIADAFQAHAVTVRVLEVAPDTAQFEQAIAALGENLPNALLLDLSAPGIARLGDVVSAARPKLPSIIASLSDPALILSIGVFRGKTFGFTTVVPNPESLSSPLANAFRADVAEYPTGISYLGLEAYLNLRVVLDTLAHSSKPPTRKSLRDALERTEAMTIGELEVAPAGHSPDGIARVGLGVLSARGVILE